MSSTLVVLTLKLFPWSMLKGKDVYPEGELPQPETDIQYTAGFYLSMHFPWAFTEHFSTILHPPHSVLKMALQPAECADTLPK